ncbi:MAG: hypothetical protein JW874_00455 [Spirochaetales bacterium]|nr:hypothetical protein [Spirochaetales bacterium]
MLKICVFNVPLAGHILPSLNVLKSLSDDGNNIIYYINKEAFPVIGNAIEDVREYPEESGRFFHSEKLYHFSSIFYTLMKFTDKYLDILLDSIRSDNPDLIVHDQFCPWGKYIGRILGIPAVASIPSIVFSRNMANRENSLLSSIFNNLNEMNEGNMLRKKIRDTYQLADYGIIDTLVNKEKSNIVFSIQAIQPDLTEYEEEFHFVGTCRSNDTRSDFRLDVSDDEAKIIYISMGTVFEKNFTFYINCIEVFRDSGYTVVIYSRSDISHLDWPDNFILAPMFSQIEILKHADVFFTHAGMNGVHEALYFNVPMIFYPSQEEQRFIATALSNLGTGVFLKSESSEDIRESVDTILKNGKYRNNAEEYGAGLRSLGGIEQAKKIITDFVYS